MIDTKQACNSAAILVVLQATQDHVSLVFAPQYIQHQEYHLLTLPGTKHHKLIQQIISSCKICDLKTTSPYCQVCGNVQVELR